MATMTIPKEYGYVLLTAGASYLVSVWHGMRVSPYRRAAGVAYPNTFASQEAIAAATPEKKQALYLFNCSQRAHYNFIENYPIALTGMLLSGLRYPVAAAALGGVWLVSRIAYAVGYTSKSEKNVAGKGRYNPPFGGLFWLCQLGFFGMVVKGGVDLIRA